MEHTGKTANQLIQEGFRFNNYENAITKSDKTGQSLYTSLIKYSEKYKKYYVIFPVAGLHRRNMIVFFTVEKV